MKILIASRDVAERIKAYSYSEVIDFFIEMPALNNVIEPLKMHSDLGMHITPERIIIEPTIYDYIALSNPRLHKCLKRGKTELKSKYPEDIAYNCLGFKKILFHHENIDENVKMDYIRNGFKSVIVKQGYVRCSSLVVDENSVITDDAGLFSIFIENGANALLVEKGDVVLRGLNYGFIGGTAGRVGDCMIFNGSLSKHRDGLKIKSFIEDRGVKILELKDDDLEDCGSILYGEVFSSNKSE